MINDGSRAIGGCRQSITIAIIIIIIMRVSNDKRFYYKKSIINSDPMLMKM